MQLIIKGHNIEIPDDLKTYIDGKISSVTQDLDEPSVCEVTLLDNNGHRGGEDKEVHIACTIPKVKNPVFVSTASNDFYKTIDIIEDKLARALHNARR